MSSDRRESEPGFSVLADRVDGEPPAILGLTTSELLLVSLTTGLGVLPLLLALAAAFDLGKFVLALAGFIFLGGVSLGAVIFRRMKRGRPQGHYIVMGNVLKQRLLGGSTFMLRGGHWALGRTRYPPSRTRG